MMSSLFKIKIIQAKADMYVYCGARADILQDIINKSLNFCQVIHLFHIYFYAIIAILLYGVCQRLTQLLLNMYS